MPQPLHIQNARIWDGNGAPVRDLYATGVVVPLRPRDALTVDLDGCTIFPGLINAHDHLELNHFPRTKYREVYDNAHRWGEDMQARLNESPFRGLRAHALQDRLFIGGLKNLLCGAAAVAHHNPLHKPLARRDFPVRVLRRYGWAHSLHFNTDDEVRAAYTRTPKDVPFFIHLAEGTDEAAEGEYRRLKALGCAGANTVLVHGVGLTDDDVCDPDISSLVWCPSTNQFLLGRTANIQRWLEAGKRVALGSDSRLTADGDLLDEMNAAQALLRDPQAILSMVSGEAATLLRLNYAGHLRPTACADFIALRSAGDDALALCRSRRADLALVVIGGVPQIGDPDVMAKFTRVPMVSAMLDGKPKLIQTGLARRILECKLAEAGLTIDTDFQPRRPLRQWWFSRGAI